MIKTSFIVATLVWAAVTGTAVANAQPSPCSVLDANPTVSGAERLIINLAESAVINGDDTEQAGRAFASDIMQNCPEYATIVWQAAENLGG